MKVKTITISAKEAVAYMENTNALFKALWELTDMLKEESNLKKHHRAYLHIRENIDAKVKEARSIMTKVSASMLDLSFMCNAPEESLECDDCDCHDCDQDCRSCKVSPCAEKDDPDCPFADAEEENDNEMILTKQKYFEMIEDILTMAELVDMVSDMRTNDLRAIRELRKYIPAFTAFEENRLRLYRDAAKEAESIMERWEDEYDPDYEPDEYFSD